MTSDTRVELELTVTLRYSGHPDDYGTDDPNEMAIIDMSEIIHAPNLLAEMLETGFQNGSAKLAVRPVEKQ